MRAVIVVRVSTEEQAKGHSLGAQELRCTAWCEEHGHEIVGVYPEAISTRKKVRPMVAAALVELRSKRADLLVCTAMDRVARTMSENVALIAECGKKGTWDWVTLDMKLDTTTAAGRMLAHTIATQSEYMRDYISERTSQGLAYAASTGVRLGRERLIEPEIEDRIRSMHPELSLSKIAKALNAEGIKSPSGGLWARSTLHRVVCRS